MVVATVTWYLLRKNTGPSGRSTELVRTSAVSSATTTASRSELPLPPAPERWLELFSKAYEKATVKSIQAEYHYSTNITDRNQKLYINASTEHDKVLRTWANEAYEVFHDTKIEEKITARQMQFLFDERNHLTVDGSKKLTKLLTKLSTRYSTAMICPANLGTSCSDQLKVKLYPYITNFMATSRNETELKATWKRWRDAAGRPSTDDFFEYVERSNSYQRSAGRESLEEAWLVDYERDQPGFSAGLGSLFEDILPLYEELHAYVRFKLNKFYGNSVVPPNGTIPAHILGNMWAQDWSNIFDLLDPASGDQRNLTDRSLNWTGWTVLDMFNATERFFRSIGFPALPVQFWEKSMFTQPVDRDVACHASAFDIDRRDKRIKMCSTVNEDDFLTIHHEMGHIYYYLAYENLPILLRGGANPGFHEAVGETIALSSLQSSYLKKLGLLSDDHSEDELSHIQFLLRSSLTNLVFAPFGYIVDLWRWEVFKGDVSKYDANDRYWELRRKFQGLHPPVERTINDFDPTAKYHVANFVPYLQYYVALFLMFQVQETLCSEVTTESDLAKCSIYSSASSGKKLWKMLKLGRSKPWPEVLKDLTGSSGLSAKPMVKYYSALQKWLRRENKKNRVCMGWGTEWPVHVKLQKPRCSLAPIYYGRPQNYLQLLMVVFAWYIGVMS